MLQTVQPRTTCWDHPQTSPQQESWEASNWSQLAQICKEAGRVTKSPNRLLPRIPRSRTWAAKQTRNQDQRIKTEISSNNKTRNLVTLTKRVLSISYRIRKS